MLENVKFVAKLFPHFSKVHVLHSVKQFGRVIIQLLVKVLQLSSIKHYLLNSLMSFERF